jgi:hypothetical protein
MCLFLFAGSCPARERMPSCSSFPIALSRQDGRWALVPASHPTHRAASGFGLSRLIPPGTRPTL